MTYVAVGEVYGGDVEDMLQFCDLISWEKKPFHATYLEEELLKRVQLWPVYLHQVQITQLLERTYTLSLRKHKKQKTAGLVPPNRIQYINSKVLRYRPNRLKTIITLDMNRFPALLSVQGYFPDIVQKYSEKAHIGPVVSVEDNKVLFPSNIADLQLSLGTVASILSR